MSAALWVGAGILGGAGALARFALDGAITRRGSGPFPLGILVVNLSGTFLLGVLAGAALGEDADRLLAGGLLGAYTTFSTWMLDTRLLATAGRRDLAALNLVASLVLGLAAIWLGRRLGLAV